MYISTTCDNFAEILFTPGPRRSVLGLDPPGRGCVETNLARSDGGNFLLVGRSGLARLGNDQVTNLHRGETLPPAKVGGQTEGRLVKI